MDVVQTNESEELSKNEKKVFYIDYLISQIPGYLAYLYYINGVLTKLKEEGLLHDTTSMNARIKSIDSALVNDSKKSLDDIFGITILFANESEKCFFTELIKGTLRADSKEKIHTKFNTYRAHHYTSNPSPRKMTREIARDLFNNELDANELCNSYFEKLTDKDKEDLDIKRFPKEFVIKKISGINFAISDDNNVIDEIIQFTLKKYVDAKQIDQQSFNKTVYDRYLEGIQKNAKQKKMLNAFIENEDNVLEADWETKFKNSLPNVLEKEEFQEAINNIKLEIIWDLYIQSLSKEQKEGLLKENFLDYFKNYVINIETLKANYCKKFGKTNCIEKVRNSIRDFNPQKRKEVFGNFDELDTITKLIIEKLKNERRIAIEEENATNENHNNAYFEQSIMYDETGMSYDVPITEFQFKTIDMDANARDGKASHVAYKNQSKEEDELVERYLEQYRSGSLSIEDMTMDEKLPFAFQSDLKMNEKNDVPESPQFLDFLQTLKLLYPDIEEQFKRKVKGTRTLKGVMDSVGKIQARNEERA